MIHCLLGNCHDIISRKPFYGRGILIGNEEAAAHETAFVRMAKSYMIRIIDVKYA